MCQGDHFSPSGWYHPKTGGKSSDEGEKGNGKELSQGVQGDHDLKGDKIPERITLDFLLLPTNHLPCYKELDELIGLIGDEYTPIKKAIYYHTVSWKYRRTLISVGKTIIDSRIHLMLRQMTGTGKENIISAIRRLSSEFGLHYGSPTSLHPEQLVGKVIKYKEKKEWKYEEIEGYFERDVIVLNEDKNYIQSEDLKYSEIRAYIRIAKDTQGSNRIEKKLVDVPSDYAIEKYPDCAIVQFGQPILIPEARVEEGDIGRDLIPFVDFEDIDQSEVLRDRILEDFEINPSEAVKDLTAFLSSLPETSEFGMGEEARMLFVDLSDLLYRYGMQYSGKVADYTQRKKTRIQNYFLRMSAIQAAVGGRKTITEEDIERAFIDYFEMLTLEFDLVERYLVLDMEMWKGVKSEDRKCLEWLLGRGATSFESSDVTINEYVSKIAELCEIKESTARKKYYQHKENEWVESKQDGQHSSKVWTLFKPKIRKITSKEFVTKAYKKYQQLVQKHGERTSWHYGHPGHPEKSEAQNSPIDERSRVMGDEGGAHPEEKIGHPETSDSNGDNITDEIFSTYDKVKNSVDINNLPQAFYNLLKTKVELEDVKPVLRQLIEEEKLPQDLRIVLEKGSDNTSSSPQVSSGSHGLEEVRETASDWLKLLKNPSEVIKFITEGE